MATITVKTQVEATPALISDALKKYAAIGAALQFPFAAGTFVELAPKVSQNMGGLEGMPALVIMTGKGSALGLVAIHKTDGDISVAFLNPSQVKGRFTFPTNQVPTS